MVSKLILIVCICLSERLSAVRSPRVTVSSNGDGDGMIKEAYEQITYLEKSNSYQLEINITRIKRMVRAISEPP